MIKISYEDIVKKINDETDLSQTEVEEKIDVKLKQLSGLISKEGAAHIVANQLGIKLVEKISGKLKINKILPGMRDVETFGKVTRIYPKRKFQVKGREGQVGSVIIGDETGSTRLVLWGEQADHLDNIKEGTIIKVMSAYVKEQNSQNEIHLGSKGSLVINPKGILVNTIPKGEIRKKINELKENMNDVEILATIVQVFDPRFYEICGECGKRIHQKEGSFVCDKHGTITPKFGYVINVFLDDGTENIRAVFFRQQVLSLLELNESKLLEFKDNPEDFEEVKTKILGNITKISGRVVKNQMFERLEFIARSVDPNPDPSVELELMEKEDNNLKSAKVSKN